MTGTRLVPRSKRRRTQRGFALSTEAVILLPVLVALLAMVVVWSRYALATTAVEASAGSAARAASLGGSAAIARADATSVAQANLASSGLRCEGVTVVVDTSGFAVPAGQPAQVRVSVACRLRTADLGLPLGTVIVEQQGAAALDRYRGRE